MPKLPALRAGSIRNCDVVGFRRGRGTIGAPGVEEAANPMDQDGQGDAQATATENTDQDAVTSPLPTGDGRSDNQ